ncbi:hypothetical protein F66182_9304 [Fusarium sp. NRRL 66182]|nr:hypothetical protein F66182_9304 [Fusarium sp. NRRL 66182]
MHRRGRGSRKPSGPWGRLKPVEQDPLQSIGLPSKGDERPPPGYLPPSSTANSAAASSSSQNPTPAEETAGGSSQAKASALPEGVAASAPSPLANHFKALRFIVPSNGPSTSTMAAIEDPDNTKALQDVLMALRKLREGLVSTKRADLFSTQAYIFSIRLSILAKHPESYHPAILHLLRYMGVWTPMVRSEIEEIAGYFMLDAACRRRNLTEAYFIRQDFNIRNKKLDHALRALAHDNFVSWQVVKKNVNQYCLKLMEWADDDIRLHTLKCFGRAYLYVDLPFLEFATDRKWNELKEKDHVGWGLEDDKVHIRRARTKHQLLLPFETRSTQSKHRYISYISYIPPAIILNLARITEINHSATCDLVMAPPRKKPRTRSVPKDDSAAGEQSTSVLADYRTSWVLKSDEQMVDLKIKGETFQVAKSVLTNNSEYFKGCLNGRFAEAKKGAVEFTDDEIEARYLALYIGLAYSHSSIVPHAPPRPASNPEASPAKTPIRDYIEVYKLCDRFISPAMGDFIERCIDVAIGNGHRALCRTEGDDGTQKALMRDFADGYEALNEEHPGQVGMGERMINYFCEGVSFSAWKENIRELAHRPKFVAQVSCGFANKLRDLQNGRKLRRKELAGPGVV